jgi:hypothetical protein
MVGRQSPGRGVALLVNPLTLLALLVVNGMSSVMRHVRTVVLVKKEIGLAIIPLARRV